MSDPEHVRSGMSSDYSFHSFCGTSNFRHSTSMGKQPSASVVEVTEKQRHGSVRPSVLRPVFRLRYTSSQQHGASQDHCRGPSLLHNLLPVLEPFLIVKPKLVFLEDHILRRKQEVDHGQAAFKLPSRLDELSSWVKEESALCDCDECSPKQYSVGKSKSHGKIKTDKRALQGRSVRFSYASQDNTHVQQPTLKLRFYGDYEAMHLVRNHIAWLDQTYLQGSGGENCRATMQLKSLLQMWGPNLTGSDMRQSISRGQLQNLFPLLNQIFFFNALPSCRKPFSSSFSWLPESRKNCFGVGFFNPFIGTHLLLHPTLYRHGGYPDDLDVRWRNRIGTILHELCHAFLKAYTCRSCPMHDHSIGRRGHGRAWQLLAAKIEQVASKLLDGYVNMGRFPSLLHDMEGHGRLPSSHDLEVYNFGNVAPVG